MKIRLRKLSIILICAFISNITNPINAKASWIYTTITTDFKSKKKRIGAWGG